MATGKLCPACGRDIGIWPIFSAGLPNRIWCPHCQTRLRYRDATGVFLVVVAVMVAVVGAAYLAATRALPDARPVVQALAFGGVLLGVWVPVELALTGYLRGHKELVSVGRPPPRPGDAGAGPADPG